MYDLGIMSNLFDAQNKVAQIYARQGALAATYRNGLAEPISALSQGFPDIQDGTKAILSGSKAYQKAQKQADQAQALASVKQIQNEKDDITKIMQQQAKNNQNKAQLAKQVMQSSDKLDDQVPQELTALSNRNEQLNQGIGNSKAEAADQLQKAFESYNQAYENEIASIKKVLQSTNGQLDASDVKNSADNSNNQETTAGSKGASSQSNQNKTITIGEYLKKKDPDLYSKLLNMDNIDDLNALYGQLPYNIALPDQVKSKMSAQDYQQIQSDIESIKNSNQQLQKLGLQPKFDGNQDETGKFEQLSKKDNKDSQSDDTKQQTQQIVLSDFKNADQDQFTITVPNKVTVTNGQQVASNTYKISVGNASKVVLNLSYKTVDLKGESTVVKIAYAHPQAKPQKVTVSNATVETTVQPEQSSKAGNDQAKQSSSQAGQTSQAENAESQKQTSNQTKVTSQTQEVSNDKDRSFAISFDLATITNDSGTSDSKLNQLIGKWVAEYNDAAKMASIRVEALKDQPIKQLMNENLDDVLESLVKQANSQHKQDNASLLALLDQDSTQLAQKKADYEKELASIGSNSKQELQNAQKQIQKLQQAQDEMNKNAEKSVSDNVSDKDSTVDMNDLSDLSDQASDTNQDVSQDSGAFDGIYQELTSLNNSIGSIQNSGKSLNGKSMNLQKAFRNELAKRGDFAQSFINVLNAAYRNGVPNQKLLNFITNPVGGTGNEVVSERTQSYNMGMWTIVLVILAWFIAYAIDNMKYFQSGKYFSKKQTKLNVHTRKLIFLGIISLLSGVVLAPIAAKQFPIIECGNV